MSVRDCIQAKGGTGKLKPKELDLTLDLFDRIRASRAGQAGGEAAEADAARLVAQATRRRAEQYRTQAALQVLVDKRNLEIIDGYNGKLRNAVSALLETDRFESRADIDNVDSVRYYVEAEAHRELREVIEEFRLKGVQIRADRAGQEDWLRAIFDAPVRGVEDGDAGRANGLNDLWGSIYCWSAATENIFTKDCNDIPDWRTPAQRANDQQMVSERRKVLKEAGRWKPGPNGG